MSFVFNSRRSPSEIYSFTDKKYIRTKLFLSENERISISIIGGISEPLKHPITGKREYSHPIPFCIGHRGSGNNIIRQFCLENSLKAAQTAFQDGADMIEFDVQLSCDKTPIIAHDFYHRTKKTLKDRKILYFSLLLFNMIYYKNFELDLSF